MGFHNFVKIVTMICERQNNGILKMSCLNPRPCEYIMLWGYGIKVSDRIKVANQLTFR